MFLTPGMIYYWISWILWTIITFVQRKSRLRTQLACLLLVVLILSNQSLAIGDYTLSISFTILFFLSFIFMTIIPRLHYHLFITTIMGLSYIVVLWIEVVEPMLLFIPAFFLIPAMLTLFNIVFIKKINHQMIVTIFGFCLGEFLFLKFLTYNDVHNQIGDLLFLDQLFMTLIALCMVYVTQIGIKALYRKLKLRRLTPEKELKIPS